jgi:hypothetical protein
VDEEQDEFGRIRRAVQLAFNPEHREAVLDTIGQYTAGPYVQMVILALGFGDQSAVEKLVAVAQRDFRDVLLYLERPEEYDPKLTKEELRRRFQEARLPVPYVLSERMVPASWLQRAFGPKKIPEIRLVAADGTGMDVGETKIGGKPSWIGEALPPACCAKAMLFLGQFDSLALSNARLPTGSLVLVFVCPSCYRTMSLMEGAPPPADDPEWR